MSRRILVAEISGKRPGGKAKRPTEKFSYGFDKVIISNDSDGYVTDWPIVHVPQDYEEWYKEHCKMSDIAYFAPMNRSYAIKYAREHGYDYLVQLDDNIVSFKIRYRLVLPDKTVESYSTSAAIKNNNQLAEDMLNYLVDVLEQTNAGMAGMVPDAASVPKGDWLRERYVYSAFVLDLSKVPSYFQGDFEDDIEYRLKLKQVKVPSIEVAVFHYSKTAQNKGNGKQDSSGNREAYIKAGLNRGQRMAQLYGDYYQRGLSNRGSGIKRKDQAKFRHKVKPFKLGVRVKLANTLKQDMLDLFAKYATKKNDVFSIDMIVPKNKVEFKIKGENYYDNLAAVILMGIKYSAMLSRKHYDKIEQKRVFKFSLDADKNFTGFLKELGQYAVIQGDK